MTDRATKSQPTSRKNRAPAFIYRAVYEGTDDATVKSIAELLKERIEARRTEKPAS